MTRPLDVQILEMMASKICHDLISPIGAVNNGVEFMREMGADAGDDAVDLIAFSAAQASAKLKAYRIAYGAGGADSHITLDDVYQAIQGIIEGDKKFSQDWDANGPLKSAAYERGYCKVITCLLLLALDCLPRGGSVIVQKNDSGGTVILATGQDARLKPGTDQALNMSIESDDVQPQNVHAYLCGVLAVYYGFALSFTEGQDGQVNFSITKE